MKYTKFGIEKYANKDNNNNNKQEKNLETKETKKDISYSWLIQKGYNCIYNSFIT